MTKTAAVFLTRPRTFCSVELLGQQRNGYSPIAPSRSPRGAPKQKGTSLLETPPALAKVIPEYHRGDRERGDCGDQNTARSHILGFSDTLSLLQGDLVGKEFQRGVE